MDTEGKMSDPAELLRNALSLDVRDRATLAERLLASLEELSEEEAERLWVEEAQRRLDEYRAGHARVVRAEEVQEKAESLAVRLSQLKPTELAAATAERGFGARAWRRGVWEAPPAGRADASVRATGARLRTQT
jgi:hypothetical protein